LATDVPDRDDGSSAAGTFEPDGSAETEEVAPPPTAAVDQPADDEGSSSPEVPATSPPAPPCRKPRKHSFGAWRRRPTNRAYLQELAGTPVSSTEIDALENDRTRLPADEEVHLGGILLAEAFTPSTIRRLEDSIRALPPDLSDKKRTELLTRLVVFRRPTFGIGSTSIGYASPSTFVMTPGFHDDAIPDGVEAVWLRIHAVTPSLTVVIATFTLTDGAGDLTALLRSDFKTRHGNIRLQVPGRLGALRAWNPYGRPRLRGSSGTINAADGEKRRACEDIFHSHQDACSRWLAARFPGCFSETEPKSRPTVRLLLTKTNPPFADEPSWRQSVGLWPAFDSWVATDHPGWSFRFGELFADNPNLITAAAQRSVAAAPSGGNDLGESSWSLTQRCHEYQGGLFARWAGVSLLALYSDRLSTLRDQAAISRHFDRPVRDAEAFNRYLMTNGLDSETLVADATRLTEDPARFAFGLPKYVQSPAAPPTQSVGATPLTSFADRLCKSMAAVAARLSTDMKAATPSITASVELRQAVMNTRLQRRLIIITLIALAISVVSLVIAITGSG